MERLIKLRLWSAFAPTLELYSQKPRLICIYILISTHCGSNWRKSQKCRKKQWLVSTKIVLLHWFHELTCQQIEIKWMSTLKWSSFAACLKQMIHIHIHTLVSFIVSCLVLRDKVKPSCSWPEEIEWFYLDFLFGNKNHLIFLILWRAALESDERTYILLLREMAKLDNPELLSCKEDRKNTTLCCGVPAFIPSRLMWSTSLKSKREITDSHSRIIIENNKAPSKITLTWCSFLQIKVFPKPNFIDFHHNLHQSKIQSNW